VRQLYHHQAYIAALKSHGSSANNHLVAEVSGLFASTCAFPLFAETQSWRMLAARTLRREIGLQTFADGLNREMATAYHGLTMELFLAAAAEDDANEQALGEEVWRGLAAMADALASMVDASGRPPAQGDDDGGFALLTDGRGFDRWASLLEACGHIFGRCGWWPKTFGGDVRAALLATRIGRRPHAERPSRPIRHFIEGGMVLLRDLVPSDDEIWCRCDCGPLGFLATSAHGHADALSVELRHGGVDILCDPGTFCYHGHDDWRGYFRSTLAHNTLELDRLDQCRAGGLFFWLDDARTTIEEVSGLDQGGVADCRAVQDGYRRLRRPAIHRRRVRLDRYARAIDIWDNIVSESSHDARLAFHLGPQVGCVLDGTTATLGWHAGDRQLGAIMSLPMALRWSLHRAERAPILGWYSSAFGLLEPTFVILGEGVMTSEPLHSRLEFAETPVDAGAAARQSRAIQKVKAKSYVQ
jgi:hypothetical protein